MVAQEVASFSPFPRVLTCLLIPFLSLLPDPAADRKRRRIKRASPYLHVWTSWEGGKDSVFFSGASAEPFKLDQTRLRWASGKSSLPWLSGTVRPLDTNETSANGGVSTVATACCLATRVLVVAPQRHWFDLVW